MTEIEIIILNNLLLLQDYTEKVISFIKKEYFTSKLSRLLFIFISAYFQKTHKLVPIPVLLYNIEECKKLTEAEFQEIQNIIKQFNTDIDKAPDPKWLVEETEKFCKERDLYITMSKAVEMIDKKKDIESIPEMIRKSLGVTFDISCGHNYTEEQDIRFQNYHNAEKKLEFDIDILNKITDGGISEKSLTLFSASAGIGKSLVMCHLASSYLLKGKNVLYITLEMSELRIAERIDANLLDVNINDLKKLTKEAYDKKIKFLKEKRLGRLIIKEYPSSSASCSIINALLSELYNKQQFVPDVMIVDYLGIMASTRVSQKNATENMYMYLKFVAEELRGLSMEKGFPIISASQLNRKAIGSMDIDMSNISDSLGIAQTADLILGISSIGELEEQNKLLFTQIKNRYGSLYPLKFVLGVDKPKMRLFNIENDIDNVEQFKIRKSNKKEEDDIPVFDKTPFGKRQMQEVDTSKFNF